MSLYVKPAREAISRRIAEPLNLTVEEAAEGIIRVVNANMVRGISVNSTQKGYDVREFSLLAFGGSGPLHAVELAQELGMNRVLIPPFCSVFSALGAVASDVRHDFVQTLAIHESQVQADMLQKIFAELEVKAREQLADENVSDDRIQLLRSADLRYEGQSYELTIPIHNPLTLQNADVAQLIADFHVRHDRLYEYSDPTESVEFISLRLAAIGQVPELDLPHQKAKSLPAPQPIEERPVSFPGIGFQATNIYRRSELQAGHRFSGPCLVEERTSTTVIPPGWIASVDGHGNIIAIRA